MTWLITFASTGGLTVEADTKDEAIRIFDEEMQEDAGRELVLNGIDITEVWEADDE